MKRVQQYIEGVLSGKIVTGNYIRLAVERHVRDLGRNDLSYYFDEYEAQKVINYFEKCRHWKGDKAGQLFKAELHQAFAFAMQYGWRSEGGGFRFDKYFETVARKNAKTTKEAVKALYHLTHGNIPGAQVWCGATKRDQAYIVINDAAQIAENTPQLRHNFRPYSGRGTYNRLVYNESSIMAAIGMDAGKEDGLDPSWVIIDEYHGHPDDGVLNILYSGGGSRLQALNMITTAGYNKQGPCYANKRKHAIDILEGKVENERFLALLFEPDEDDDWMDETTWVKSNPNLDVSVKLDFLRSRFVDAKNEGGTTEVDFKTKNLNMWVGSAKTWIPDDVWMKCVMDLDEEDLYGQECYGGLDLASVNDTIAFSLLFPGDTFQLLTWYFIPEDTVQQRIRKESVNYLKWIKDGHVIITPGNVRDDDILIEHINKICQRFSVQVVGYDDWESFNIVPKLVELGHNFARYPQNYSTFNAPIKEFYKYAMNGQLNHFGNPVTRWQVGNVVLKTDTGGRVKFDKEKATDKIDGPVSAVMAFGCWFSVAGEPEFKSNYDNLENIDV